MSTENNNNVVLLDAHKSSGIRNTAPIKSGLDYGVVCTAPTPPPMPGQASVTHFPSMPRVLESSSGMGIGEMSEKRHQRVSYVNGSLGKHSLSSNINIVTAPNLVDHKPILPGIYK